MASKAALLAIVIGLVSLGFACKKPAQLPPSAQVPSGTTTSTTTTTEWKEYKNVQAGYTVQIPLDWNIRDILGDGTVIGINKGPVPLRDVIDSIRIEVKQNPSRLPVEVYYRQTEEIQLFEDAKGGVEQVTINGRSATWFRDVIGLVTVDVIVIPTDTRMIEFEISDLDINKNIFDFMLRSLSLGAS